MSASPDRPAPRGGTAVVTGVGVVTAVGSSAEQTATSIRAGVRRVAERPLAGAGGDPGEEGGVYLASSAEGLSAAFGAAAPVDLALAAAREALWAAGLYEPRDVEAAYRRSAVAVFLALPYADAPGADAALAGRFVEAAVSSGLLARGRPEDVVGVRNGHAAGLLALSAASGRLAAGEIDVALVGGLDTPLDPERIADMNRRSRLRTDRAPGGAIPGEGSAFVVLERLEDALRRKAACCAALESVAQDTEAVPYDGTEPSRADGATRAVTRVLGAAHSARRIEDVWTDLNGERGRFLEWALLEARCLSALPAGVRRQLPAAVVGDLGAASGVLLVALAAHGIRAGRGTAGAALVCAASERGERAAAVLASPRGGKEG